MILQIIIHNHNYFKMDRVQFNYITTWQNKTFPTATALSKIYHLEQEIIELKKELEADNENKLFELADCFLLLFGAAAKAGMKYDDIIECIDNKMQININRKWGKPDENGIINHVKQKL